LKLAQTSEPDTKRPPALTPGEPPLIQFLFNIADYPGNL
jgi:hypothetical protein